jgi:hypothetical protein
MNNWLELEYHTAYDLQPASEFHLDFINIKEKDEQGLLHISNVTVTLICSEMNRIYFGPFVESL